MGRPGGLGQEWGVCLRQLRRPGVTGLKGSPGPFLSAPRRLRHLVDAVLWGRSSALTAASLCSGLSPCVTCPRRFGPGPKSLSPVTVIRFVTALLLTLQNGRLRRHGFVSKGRGQPGWSGFRLDPSTSLRGAPVHGLASSRTGSLPCHGADLGRGHQLGGQQMWLSSALGVLVDDTCVCAASAPAGKCY